MRCPEYLSYSSFSLAEKNDEEFHLKYLCEKRPPRIPQEHPASVGSAFDARTKAELHSALFGAGSDPKYSYEALFESQVEPQNRDFAKVAGERVFEQYVYAGAYERLLELLKKSIEPPRFEFDVKGTILGVPFTGKPDCRFVLAGPVHVVHDWKVNGYCGKATTSPNKGYMLCMDGYKSDKQSMSNGQAHKQFVPMDFHGLTIDTGYMEDCSPEWADQLSCYGWLLGEEIGDEKVVLSLDQTVCSAQKVGPPVMRVATFRARVRKSYQQFLAKRLVGIWERIKSGHIFKDLSKEENDARITILEKQSVALQSDGSANDEFFKEVVRPKYRG
jgi:hypothetical protein